MKIRLLHRYDTLTNLFWFLLAIMAVLAVGAALASTAVDHSMESDRV
jgi:uncharacterized membrane protein